MVKRNIGLVFVLLFAILAGWPLLHPGLPPTHDGEYHVVRFYEFDKTLRSGDLYPRWAADFNNGYGIPLFTYVYPLSNYIASILHTIGVSFIDAFKLNMFVATLVGAVFFYLWVKEYAGKIGGVVGSVFYTFAPYHLLDIYVRGSVGEVWALAWYPVFLYGITRYLNTFSRNWLCFSAGSFALIIFSHNILALLFAPFAISYLLLLLVTQKEKKTLKSFLPLVFGVFLTAIFWLPALVETEFVQGLEIFDVTAHFTQLYELLIPSWGTGFSGIDSGNKISFQVGVANLLILFLCSILILVQFFKRNKYIAVLLGFFLFWSFLLIFLMLSISEAVWKTVPLMQYFQFPWRMLSLLILCCSFLAGYLLHLKNSRILAGIAILFVLFTTIGYTKPAYYHLRSDNYYTARSNFMDGTNSPGNTFQTKWFGYPHQKTKEKIVVISGNAYIQIHSLDSTNYVADVQANSDFVAQVNTAYFPGWAAYAGEKKVTVKENNGIMYITLPNGTYKLRIFLQKTPIQQIATAISLLSTLIIVGIFFLPKIPMVHKT